MSTVSPKVYKHHQKADGSYNIKIRIYHRGEKKYIDTEYFLTDKQLTKELMIKDPFIKKGVTKLVDSYREEITKLEGKLQNFTAESLKNYLVGLNEDIDFIKFCDHLIAQMKELKRTVSAANFTTVRNSLVDYFKSDSVSIKDITSQFLRLYERYLRTTRAVTRLNQFQTEVTVIKKGLCDQSIYNYTRDLRTIFNEARKTYNNSDLGVIKINHYPFTNYKMVKPPPTKKRNLNLEKLIALRDCECQPNSRAELARDLFMLSFYLCGMNAVDFYNYLELNCQTRIEYNRSKTSGKRQDNAFISIRIIPEAGLLIDKYGGTFKGRYANYKGLDKALSKGFEVLREITGLKEITFYWARHTFANLAYNVCKLNKDHIAQALNHVDDGHKTTDIYIEKDWAIVDNVQAVVIKLLKSGISPNVESHVSNENFNDDDLKFLGSLILSESLDYEDRKKVMDLHYKLKHLAK